MSRTEQMFLELEKRNQGAFIPFVVLFDPNRDLSKKIICSLVEAGADGLELGIPFSDPLADGPTVQKASLRALANRPSVQNTLELIHEIRELYPQIPIGILTYANLVFKNSMNWFYELAAKSGVDSVLVADVPLLEAKPFCEAAVAHGIDPVLIAPPNLPQDRVKVIADLCKAYTYVVTRAGVTGADDTVKFHHKDLLRSLNRHNAPRPVFGFGISAPEHVRLAMREGASGVISGSRIITIIEQHMNDEKALIDSLKNFVRSMKKASEKHR